LADGRSCTCASDGVTAEAETITKPATNTLTRAILAVDRAAGLVNTGFMRMAGRLTPKGSVVKPQLRPHLTRPGERQK
jgi:hypothetical protein